MVSDEYKEYLKTPIWQELRSARLKIDGYKCQRCRRPFGLQIHHLRYPKKLGTEDPYTDLITLCDRCHDEIEQEKQKARKEEEDQFILAMQQLKKEKEEREERYRMHRKLVRQFIKEHEKEDISNIGIGKKNYCDLNVLKADFYPWMEKHNAYQYGDGYISGVGNIQTHFRNRRYEIILDLMEQGYPKQIVHNRTLFSYQMIQKVFEKPEQARDFLRKEREENNNA